MCTAISWHSGCHYFGRNLDLDYSYSESVTITPRNYTLVFRNLQALPYHFAMIGIATVIEDYPLYYDATNEYGLSVAALNFPGNAYYGHSKENKNNVAPFELIPWILSQCKNIEEAQELLDNLHLADIQFNQDFPNTPLHWMISDKNRSIVVENTKTGLNIYNNPIHVLTNNPPFEYHMHNLCNYMQLSSKEPQNHWNIPELKAYSLGMGAIGLPGDLSSASRFVRAAFTMSNAKKYDQEELAVEQFFHILASVSQTEGCVKTQKGLEKTIYSSCCNTEYGIYYYKTYFASQTTAIEMTEKNKSGKELSCYPLKSRIKIQRKNI